MKPNLKLIQPGCAASAPDAETIRKLSAALSLALQIQSGRHLIYCLGSGKEASNQEALESWVRSQLFEHGLNPTRQALAFLMVELEKSLKRWEADA